MRPDNGEFRGHSCDTSNRRVLIVCSDAANTSVIEQATSGWMIETVVCSSLKEVRPLLAMQEVAVIFCEDRLRDGSYRDLLSLISGGTRRTPVVVMISDMNRGPTYREVLEAGAFDVIASPCSKKDVQWMVLRAMQPEHLLHISKRN